MNEVKSSSAGTQILRMAILSSKSRPMQQVIDEFSSKLDKIIDMKVRSISFALDNGYPVPIQLNEFIDEICKVFQISHKLLMSKSRKKELVVIRDIGIFFLHQVMGFTLKQSANAFNRSDHTSGFHSVHKVLNAFETQDELIISAYNNFIAFGNKKYTDLLAKKII